MTKELRFLDHCVRIYGSTKNITKERVSFLFTKFGVWGQIYSRFDEMSKKRGYELVEIIDRMI